MASDESHDPVIELGDRIRLYGGKYDKTTGRVIYRTVDALHIIPDGLTNRALEFTITEEGFEPESGVESVEILQKRKKPELVEILDLNVDQDLETFGPDGEPFKRYRIVKVNTDDDSITVHNEDEGDVTIDFGFKGVDPKNLPFRVIRGRQAAEPTALSAVSEEGDEGEEVEGEEVEGEEVEGEEVEGEEVEDFTFLDDELEESPADFSEGVETLIEIPTSERTYSSQSQKSEAYADLLSLNTAAMQKRPETQKSTRILTELFFQLRAAILRSSNDGTPKGVKPSSIQTLVDVVETRNFALSRPVIDIDKQLYHDDDNKDESSATPGIRMRNFHNAINASVSYLETSSDMNGQKFQPFLNNYLSRFASTWYPSSWPTIAFQRDEEAFRTKAPDAESQIPGYPRKLPKVTKTGITADHLNKVPMSLVRGLKAIRTRGNLIQAGEEAAVSAYIMFPLRYADSLTTLRQESIVRDVQAGITPFQNIKDIVPTDGLSDVPSATDPFIISVDGGNLGNIPLREYLKATNLRAEGLGDVWPIQTLMGMKEREWTIDQQEVLKEAITITQNQILAEVAKQREVLAQHVSQPPAVQGIQMVPDGAQLIEKLAGEPILKELQQSIKDQMPAFANSDVTMVALLLRQHPEMSMAQLADQPAALTRSRMKYARDEYLITLRNIQLKKQRVQFAGKPPVPVNCSHVKPLAMIRKTKDTNQRLALLSKFLITFQGVKQDNWVTCNAGDHNLLCVHELLQVYQYLRPGDVAALNKDIQLNFGGGQFQGYYICRNCGQPINEVEYDTHLEFDDNGRPMMGRSELVDTDAITQQQIQEFLGPLADLEAPEEFDNETKKLIYTTAKQIADKLMAPLDHSDFVVITNRTYGIIQQIPTRERYLQIQEAQRKSKATVATATVATATAATGTDYDVYINQALVCTVGVHTLLLIQTKRPDLILRGTPTGCRNLRGQPLEPEGGTQGIQCVISIISAVQKDAPPWNLTQFQKETDDTKRQKLIAGIFEPILRASLQDPTILQALSQKREYRRKILGAAGGQGRPDEIIPASFAPIPYSMKAEEFVEKVIIPEAASPHDLAELWIRQGNFIAKKTKMAMPLVFTETSCCLSPLHHVDEFWGTDATQKSLPTFSKRMGLIPPPKITRAEPTMIPSKLVQLLPDAPEDSYFLLFLEVCYDGEKKGHTHEFGLTHKCIWCNLQLPAELELLTPEQGLATIEQQGIEVTKETFEDLLNETHRVNSFKTQLLTEIPGPLDNWISLMSMEPEPTEGYKEVMAKTQTQLTKLPVDAKEVEVALALSEFSILAGSIEQKCKVRLPKSQHDVFDSIMNGGAESVIRFLQSYVVVPIKQVVSKMNKKDFKIPKSWDLSTMHMDDLDSIWSHHRGYLWKFPNVQLDSWLLRKIETLIAQTRAIISKLEVLRPLQIPGGNQTYGFFLRFCLYAPLANFVDPNVLPNASNIEAPESQVEQQALFPAKFISDMVIRFKEEGFQYTPAQIRELIAKRNEMEKNNIIMKMSGMTRIAKDIEIMNMRLGIGEYSVGGTKAIYAYDQDRYDIEREQRAQAGIVDFPGIEGGREMDGLGYYNAGGDEEGYIGDGDLAEIMGFDED